MGVTHRLRPSPPAPRRGFTPSHTSSSLCGHAPSRPSPSLVPRPAIMRGHVHRPHFPRLSLWTCFPSLSISTLSTVVGDSEIAFQTSLRPCARNSSEWSSWSSMLSMVSHRCGRPATSFRLDPRRARYVSRLCIFHNPTQTPLRRRGVVVSPTSVTLPPSSPLLRVALGVRFSPRLDRCFAGHVRSVTVVSARFRPPRLSQRLLPDHARPLSTVPKYHTVAVASASFPVTLITSAAPPGSRPIAVTPPCVSPR